VTGALAVLLAVLGAVIIGRKIARPLARITRLTEAVAAGKTEGNIPYTDRRDEVGALARSIAFF
jgi:methyl-accepting chemotaxis protein